MMLKTTDFQMLQSMLIVPSLLQKLSSRERNFEKWCFGIEKEAQEGLHFCQTMLVHPNIMNICHFSTQFFTSNQTTQDICTERNEFKKNINTHHFMIITSYITKIHITTHNKYHNLPSYVFFKFNRWYVAWICHKTSRPTILYQNSLI